MDELTALAIQASNGDRAALASFIRASQADVWRLCAHLVSPDQAEDLTQEVYLRAVPALVRFRGESSARTWLLSIARRTCMDALRKVVRDRRLMERVRSMRHDQLAVPDAASDGADLHDLVDALDPDRRAAFVLTQVLGMSYGEAAEVCDVPVGTIRSRVARARGDLLAALSAGDDLSNEA